MKKRYVIAYIDLFGRGYVKCVWRGHGTTVPFQNDQQALAFATKFRFKWVAQICCWMFNREHYLKTFSIEKI